MVEIPVTNKALYYALLKAKELGSLNNSILKGAGNLTGFVGEEAFKVFLNNEEHNNTYNYDILHDNIRFEVKSKRTTVIPKDYYECSVADYNTTQRCDYYVFTRVLWPKHDKLPSKVYLMGYYNKEDYYKNARKLTKGSRDGDNGFVVHADCWNMKYSDLLDIKDIKQQDKL
jgi:hypothetical protein